MRDTARVEPDRAELSSTATSLGELLARVTASAEALHTSGDDALAAELFEVERSLRAAMRRLDAVLRRLH